MLKKITKFLSGHKIVASIIIIALICVAYFGFKAITGKKTQTMYVLASVEKGTIITSISGSGQVAASDQADVKSKVSGDVVYVGVKKGQQVKAGTLLVQLDNSDAQKAVRDAEINLEKANLVLEQMQGMATDEGTLRGIKEKAQDDLKKAYDDGFNTVANSFLNLPAIMTGLHDILFSFSFSINQGNIDFYTDTIKDYDTRILQYRDDAYNKYQTALRAYDKNFGDYKTASRFSETSVIESLISETYDTVKNLAEAIKSSINLIQFYQNRIGDRKQALSDTHLSNLASYTGTTNSFLGNLLSIKTTIQTDKESITNTTFDIADQKIQIEEMQNALSDAKEKLPYYYIRAPFDGLVTVMDIKKGDAVGSSTIITTLITQQKIAEISLNEVDVAKVKVGQKVTLTFDAVDGLSITGEVADVDTMGTVSQGVVTYNVKIVFDTQDERVKSGMSVSASIIIDTKQDVLLVPNSAIKSSGETNYVEIPNEEITVAASVVGGITLQNSPREQQIQIGLANDSYTEVTSGLKEGDKIITQTIATGAASTTSTQTNNSFRIPGAGGFRD